MGWSEEELTSRPYVEFVHPDDANATNTETDRMVGGGDVIRFQNRYRCKDGSYRHLMWRATPDPERGLIYAVARDVTDEKLADQRMQAVVDQAEGRPVTIEALERFDFYAAAKRSFAIIRTGDSGPYGCFILKKGVVDLPEL